MIKILQRYTLREVIGPTVLGLVVFTFLLLVAEIFRIVDYLVNTNVTLLDALTLIGCILPTLLPVTMPMALLLGVVLGFGRMASDFEVMAIRTSGVHLWRVCWPIIVMCALLSGAMVYVNGWLAPSLRVRARDLQMQLQFKILSALEPGIVHSNFGDDDWGFWFRDSTPDTGELERVALKMNVLDEQRGTTMTRRASDLDESRTTDTLNKIRYEVMILAPRGRLKPNMRHAQFELTLRDGTMTILDRDPKTSNTFNVGRYRTLTHTISRQVGQRSSWDQRMIKDDNEMTSSEIADSVHRIYTEHPNLLRKIPRFKIQIAERLSLPLACVSVILLGIPLAIRIRPSANTIGFAIALALTFVYYLLLKWGVSVGASAEGVPAGQLNPQLLLGYFLTFSPNFLLGGIGVALMIRTIRQ